MNLFKLINDIIHIPTRAYNPLAATAQTGRPVTAHALLSPAERIEKRLFQAGQAVLFAGLSIAAVFTIGPLATLAVTLAAGGMIWAGNTYATRKMRSRFFEKNAYDLSRADDRRAFNAAHGHHYPQIAEKLLYLSERCGLNKPPVVAFTADVEHAGAIRLGADDFLLLSPNLLPHKDTNEPPQSLHGLHAASERDLLSSAAHEYAHLRFKDSSHHTLSNTIKLTAGMLAVGSAIALAPFAGIVAYFVTHFACDYATNKISRHNERRADRFALIHTGYADEHADLFQVVAALTENGKPVPRSVPRMIRAVWDKNHPCASERVALSKIFAEQNRQYSNDTAAAIDADLAKNNIAAVAKDTPAAQKDSAACMQHLYQAGLLTVRAV